MGYITELYVAPKGEIQKIADSPSVPFPSAAGKLEYLSDMALIRLQALIDGITGWDEAFDAVAIEFESEDHAESTADDGGWSCVIPGRFTKSFAALSDADIGRLAPVWGAPDTHAGQHFPPTEISAMIHEVRALASLAIAQDASLIFSTRE